MIIKNKHLKSLQFQHFQLKCTIANENRQPFPDDKNIKSLKIKKLHIKDQIYLYSH